MILSVLDDVVVVDHHETCQVLALVANHHRVGNVGRELELVLDLARSDVLAPGRDDDVLHAVGDLEEALVVDLADVAGVEPPVTNRLGRLLGLVEVTHEDELSADQDLALLGDPDFAVGDRAADRAGLDVARPKHGGDAGVLGLAVALHHVDAECEIPADQIG